jgi:ADP-heptose:LPS heptosyltransferase
MSDLPNDFWAFPKKIAKFFILQMVDGLSLRRPTTFKPKTLLLVRLDAIGDYVLFRNFLEFLRKSQKYQGHHLTLCGNIAWRNMAETYDADFIDDFIWIDKRKFLRNFFYRWGVLKDIGLRGFEVAIHPTFSREYYFGDAIIKASGAQERIGNYGDLSNMESWQKKLADNYYTKLIKISDANILEFYKNKEFFEKLLDQEIPITKPHIEVNKFPPKNLVTGKYALIFPGARNERKRWATDKFAQIAEHLTSKYGLKMLVAGSDLEKKWAQQIIAEAEKAEVQDLTGRTTLREVTELISQADIVVANDTFAAHVAVAVDTKIIYLLTGEHFGRFGPYPQDITHKTYLVYPHEIMEKISADFDSLTEKYKYNSLLDVNQISVAEVIKLLDQALAS